MMVVIMWWGCFGNSCSCCCSGISNVLFVRLLIFWFEYFFEHFLLPVIMCGFTCGGWKVGTLLFLGILLWIEVFCFLFLLLRLLYWQHFYGFLFLGIVCLLSVADVAATAAAIIDWLAARTKIRGSFYLLISRNYCCCCWFLIHNIFVLFSSLLANHALFFYSCVLTVC